MIRAGPSLDGGHGMREAFAADVPGLGRSGFDRGNVHPFDEVGGEVSSGRENLIGDRETFPMFHEQRDTPVDVR